MVSKAKTTVTFHSGILTIGGTVIEVAYKDAHIFFDFGTEFRPELALPDETLPTLLANRLVPKLAGVYDPNLTHDQKTSEFSETAVFLSHAHLDHSKMINYLDPKIPLYTLKETASILRALNRQGTFLLPAYQKEAAFVREMIGLNGGDQITVGEIVVTILPVDHDAYGAAGLLIHTPDKFLVYTGDLRLHGYDRQLTEDFCQQAKGCDLLMMEGVSISFEDEEKPGEMPSEAALVDRLAELVAQNPDRQLTFNAYPANIKRFAKIIEEVPRKVVLTGEMAALLKEVLALDSYYYLAENQERPTNLDPQLQVSLAELQQDSSQYLWQIKTGFENLQRASIYFHLDAEPLGAFDPAYQVFLDQLAKLKIEFVPLACSGHAVPDDLDRIISMIQPKTLVPIHTLKPEKLVNPYGERILPTRGETIS